MGDCSSFTYAATHPAECGASVVVNDAAQRVLKQVAEAAAQALDWMLSVWMRVPTPNLLKSYSYGDSVTGMSASPQLSAPLAAAWSALGYVSAALLFISIIWVTARAVYFDRSHEAARSIPLILFNFLAVVSFGVVMVWVLIGSSDQYSLWIMQRVSAAAGADGADYLKTLIKVSDLTQLGFVAGSLFSLVLFFAIVGQVAFMIFRGAILVLLVAFWPAAAAASGTQAGREVFLKICRWLLAMTLYKPVAATIYAIGATFLYKLPGHNEGIGESLTDIVVGATTLCLATLALPALVKALAPPAGIGASSAFSGGAIAGAMATGAVMLGTAGAGGAAPTGATGAIPAPAGGPAAGPVDSMTPAPALTGSGPAGALPPGGPSGGPLPPGGADGGSSPRPSTGGPQALPPGSPSSGGSGDGSGDGSGGGGTVPSPSSPGAGGGGAAQAGPSSGGERVWSVAGALPRVTGAASQALSEEGREQ